MWATSHGRRGSLKPRVLGLTAEQWRASHELARTYVAKGDRAWVMPGYTGGPLIVRDFAAAEPTVIEIYMRDGPKEDPKRVKKTRHGAAWKLRDPENGHGEFWLLGDDGSLAVHDGQGLIARAEVVQ